MNKLLVYADFDWLEEAQLIGELSHESLRGSDSYGFSFSNDWLSKHAGIILSEDLNNYPGQQYTQAGKDLFGCFSDALPDRWGRTLLNRREQLQAIKEERSPRRLSSFDYLIGIDDFSRMGGFRFKETVDGTFINTEESFAIPPLANLSELMLASHELENTEVKNQLPDDKWLTQLVNPGSSLGGARPKSSVIGENKQLYIAKFPSKKDDYNVGLWEHLCHRLAASVGIHVATTRVIQLGKGYHTLLSQRFDRTDTGRPIHFASAMTLLGLTDGDNASTEHGYLDIVDFIAGASCTDVMQNLEELYRRVAFNICIGNSDDHFRNHGFLLTAKGWTLSPAYDMNPTSNDSQSLLISASTNKADLNILLAACEDYLLPKHVATRIITEVATGIQAWKALAHKVKVAKREMNLFEDVFGRASRFLAAHEV